MAICIPEKSKNIWDFDPRSIPGCQVWFDAADTSTITGSSTVTAWRDKSRNGWNATTLIGTAPTNTTVNGLNAVSFAGQSTLTVSNVTFSSVQSRAIFVVYRVPTSTPNYISWFSTQAFNINNQGGHNNFVYPLGGGGPYLQSYAVGGAIRGMGADPAVSTIGTTAIACMIHSAVSTSRNTVTLNGTSYALSTNTLASGYGSGTVTYYIGNAYPQPYILCEYILYQEEFTVAQRQQVEGYLAHKWGIKTSLPATHPFYSLKPHLRVFQPTDISGCELWFDGGDSTTMFQNTAGTTPVTNAAQSVACWKDKIRNLSLTDTGIDGRASVAPSSVSGGGVLFNNVNNSPNSSTQSLGAFSSGATNQTSFLFRMPTKSMTLITATLPLSNNGYKRICLMGSYPLSGGPPNFLIGPQMGASEGGTILIDLNVGMSAWGQQLDTTSGYNSSAVLRIDTLTVDTTGSWFTNGVANTPTTNTSYTSTNSNYPVNFIYFAGYSGTIDGGRSFNGTIYEMLLYSKVLTTVERQQVEGYLANKWKLQLSFPATFPFRTLPSSSLAQTIVPSTIATVTLSSLSGSGGTITWTTSTNAVNYKWYVGTTFPTALVSGTVDNVLTTAVSFAFVASTNYFAWVIPVSFTRTDGATTQSAAASYTAGGNITSANLNTIATYLRSYMSEFRNPSFYGYNLDGTSYHISDGGGDMYDNGNATYPWLISGAQFTSISINQQAFSINYSATTATTIDTDFIYASLGYRQGTGVSSIHPLTVLGFRSTVGRPVGFQLAGNSGADGAGTLASGILYAGTTLSGFTVHAFYRETYNTGDPSHCNLFILLGHTNWSSVFGTISSFADPVSNGGNGAYFFTSGATVKNILAIQTLLSKSGGALVSAAECQTVVQAFASRIKLSLGF